jgi:hypothetical protein
MTTVANCGGCGGTVYRLTTAAGPVVVLDTVETPLGVWAIHGDQARRLDNIDVLRAGAGHVGYRRHECEPAEQGALFDVGGDAA